MIHPAIKLVHVLAIVLWLGPAIGAYWILLRMGGRVSEQDRLEMERSYEFVLRVEHGAFLVLLLTGLSMLYQIGAVFQALDWLVAKLVLVCAVVLIEVFDVYFSHCLFRRLARQSPDGAGPQWASYLKRRRTFYVIVVPILFCLVMGIFYLVFFQPATL